ncbi:hypothetical protein A8F94_03405 [Bacillus sp. FJAT-27225]|nr:hypothetical protein A8F94_03405 [Bacillus sp. FJAT-27225]
MLTWNQSRQRERVYGNISTLGLKTYTWTHTEMGKLYAYIGETKESHFNWSGGREDSFENAFAFFSYGATSRKITQRLCDDYSLELSFVKWKTTTLFNISSA